MGREKTNRKLYFIADWMSKCSSACMALCEPHPGHFKFVSRRNGHLGNRWLFSGLYE